MGTPLCSDPPPLPRKETLIGMQAIVTWRLFVFGTPWVLLFKGTTIQGGTYSRGGRLIKSQRSTKASISHEPLKLLKRLTTHSKEESKIFQTHINTFPHSQVFARYILSKTPPPERFTKTFISHEPLKLLKRPTTRWKEELKSFKIHLETFHILRVSRDINVKKKTEKVYKNVYISRTI